MTKRKKGLIHTLLRYHELILFLTYREIRIRYKQTVLGIAWALAQPLLQMVVFTFVFAKLGRMSAGEMPYAAFVLAGLLPWTFFANALSRGVPIITNYPNLVTKIYFPREIFPMFATLGLAADFFFSLLVLLGLLLFYQIPIQMGLLWGIGVMGLVVCFAMGFLFFASTINVFFRDATYAVGLLAQVWLFLTPVVYPLEKVPAGVRFWYDLNPMVGLVEAFRGFLLTGSVSDPVLLAKSAVISMIVFILGYRFLKHFEMKLADVI